MSVPIRYQSLEVLLSPAETFLAYAVIFEAPRYDQESGQRLTINDANVAAAEALRFYAAWLMSGKG